MLSVVFLFSLVLAGCSGGEDKKQIKLAYVAWDSEIASTNVVKTVLEEKLGYEVEMLQVDAGPMWQGVSDGSADAMVAAWLPGTHQSYYERFEGQFEDLGANLEGAAIGLVVPTYVEANSIEDLADPAVAELFGGEIIGIEPGAGVMTATENAIEAYGLDLTLVNSSSAAMAQELQKAYDEQRAIAVTGWTPHWKFAKMDLKYLEDPQGVFGEAEHINTIVRQGLAEDMPDAYKLLDQFNWSPDDMAAVMVAIQEGTDPEAAAKAWVDANEDKVNAWLEGVE
ncbi:glycine/betaine ABC transporter substrate-binding protein [Xylanibacillus composti]|nr:glycine/betaine ABC transporter substrate-binding protein [Xylanibacillus composti]